MENEQKWPFFEFSDINKGNAPKTYLALNLAQFRAAQTGKKIEVVEDILKMIVTWVRIPVLELRKTVLLLRAKGYFHLEGGEIIFDRKVFPWDKADLFFLFAVALGEIELEEVEEDRAKKESGVKKENNLILNLLEKIDEENFQKKEKNTSPFNLSLFLSYKEKKLRKEKKKGFPFPFLVSPYKKEKKGFFSILQDNIQDVFLDWFIVFGHKNNTTKDKTGKVNFPNVQKIVLEFSFFQNYVETYFQNYEDKFGEFLEKVNTCTKKTFTKNNSQNKKYGHVGFNFFKENIEKTFPKQEKCVTFKQTILTEEKEKSVRKIAQKCPVQESKRPPEKDVEAAQIGLNWSRIDKLEERLDILEKKMCNYPDNLELYVTKKVKETLHALEEKGKIPSQYINENGEDFFLKSEEYEEYISPQKFKETKAEYEERKAQERQLYIKRFGNDIADRFAEYIPVKLLKNESFSKKFEQWCNSLCVLQYPSFFERMGDFLKKTPNTYYAYLVVEQSLQRRWEEFHPLTDEYFKRYHARYPNTKIIPYKDTDDLREMKLWREAYKNTIQYWKKVNLPHPNMHFDKSKMRRLVPEFCTLFLQAKTRWEVFYKNPGVHVLHGPAIMLEDYTEWLGDQAWVKEVTMDNFRVKDTLFQKFLIWYEKEVVQHSYRYPLQYDCDGSLLMDFSKEYPKKWKKFLETTKGVN